MAKFESTNPLLNVERIQNYDRSSSTSVASQETALMTLSGTAKKSAALIIMCIVSAAMVFTSTMQSIAETGSPAIGGGIVVGALIGAFVCYLVGIFAVKTAFICAPLYAILEGVALGSLSATFEMMYPGIVFQATSATFAVTLVMFFGFSFGIFKVTQKFKSVIMAAGVGIMLTYAFDLIYSLFTGHSLNFMAINSSTPMISIGISVIVCIVAACFLLLDFDNIARLHGNVSKHYEWVCAMGLLATIVWLYIELLKLIAKISNSSNN